MSKLKTLDIELARYEHFERIEKRETDKNMFYNTEIWGDTIVSSVCYAFLDDKNVIFMGGIRPFYKGVGEAWIVCSQVIENYKRELLYYSKMYMEIIMKEGDFHRAQVTIKADWYKAIAFIEKIGFKREGLMCKYGPDESDYYLYARVR